MSNIIFQWWCPNNRWPTLFHKILKIHSIFRYCRFHYSRIIIGIFIKNNFFNPKKVNIMIISFIGGKPIISVFNSSIAIQGLIVSFWFIFNVFFNSILWIEYGYYNKDKTYLVFMIVVCINQSIWYFEGIGNCWFDIDCILYFNFKRIVVLCIAFYIFGIITGNLLYLVIIFLKIGSQILFLISYWKIKL